MSDLTSARNVAGCVEAIDIDCTEDSFTIKVGIAAVTIDTCVAPSRKCGYATTEIMGTVGKDGRSHIIE
jgi:hypothetical protein